MLRISLIVSLFLIIFSQPALASDPDLSIRSSDITFSKSELISGETIRIYAAVQNLSDQDVTGYVLFYHGSTPIGASQTVTIPADGAKDSVWVDFTVPYGSFNIRAEIRGTDPADINSANDLAITSLFYPTLDEDRDGIADDADNCSEKANADQADYDNDGKGDLCDSDDDNDGLSDAVEAELGTFPKNSDSDNDGVTDAKDWAPLDSSIQVEPAPEPVIATYNQDVIDVSAQDDVSADTPVSSDQPVADEITTTVVDEGTNEEIVIDETAEPNLISAETASFSAAFTTERLNWKTYSFTPMTPDLNGITYKWEFGDGVVSSQANVEHSYRSAGKYTITLTTEDSDGNKQVETQELNISQFHLANPLVWLALGVLALLFFGSILLIFKRRKNRAGAVKKMSVDDSGKGSAFADLDGEETEEASDEIDEEEMTDEDEEETMADEEEIPEELEVEEADENEEETEELEEEEPVEEEGESDEEPEEELEEETSAIEDDLDEEEEEQEEGTETEDEVADDEDVIQASELDEEEQEEVEEEEKIPVPVVKKKMVKKVAKKPAVKKAVKKLAKTVKPRAKLKKSKK